MSNVDLIEIFKNFPPELATTLISMIPVMELRVSIPIALFVYKLPVFSAIFFAVLGDIIPSIIILLGLEKIYFIISKFSKTGRRMLKNFFDKTQINFSGKYAKYGAMALVILTALPLPFTGAWSASVAAFIFRIPFKIAFPLICLGVLSSATIVTLISLGIIAIV